MVCSLRGLLANRVVDVSGLTLPKGLKTLYLNSNWIVDKGLCLRASGAKAWPTSPTASPLISRRSAMARLPPLLTKKMFRLVESTRSHTNVLRRIQLPGFTRLAQRLRVRQKRCSTRLRADSGTLRQIVDLRSIPAVADFCAGPRLQTRRGRVWRRLTLPPQP